MFRKRRRQFITLLGGMAAWPFAAGAQQADRVRRIGLLIGLASDDPESSRRLTAFVQGLERLGWSEGRNLHTTVRFGAGDALRVRKYAEELVVMAPDAIMTTGSLSLGALLQATRKIPIVFAQVADPVGAGFVQSLAWPGGNATGFTTYEYGVSRRWLELLKEIAPRVTRIGVVRDDNIAAGIGQLATIQSVAPSFAVELRPIGASDAEELERTITAFARIPNGGLIVVGGAGTTLHRQLIVTLAARRQLPAVYPYRFFVADGGLVSYGPDNIEPYRRAASYVDRILKGENPADLPVQTPTRYELVVNLRTAKALNIEVPQTLLARADEVID
jgi:putative tryptophan/tyrosine transport system substrate-binding protein